MHGAYGFCFRVGGVSTSQASPREMTCPTSRDLPASLLGRIPTDTEALGSHSSVLSDVRRMAFHAGGYWTQSYASLVALSSTPFPHK